MKVGVTQVGAAIPRIYDEPKELTAGEGGEGREGALHVPSKVRKVTS